MIGFIFGAATALVVGMIIREGQSDLAGIIKEVKETFKDD